jgi:hypothetical protein
MITILSAGILSSAVQSFPVTWGYLDPGSGSMMLQVLLAGLLSSSFFVKSWIRQIRDGAWLKKPGA